MRSMARLLAAATLASLSPFPAAAGERYLEPVFADVEVVPDLSFGRTVNNRGEDQELFLDVYRPAGDAATGRAAIVYAHGGGFRSYDRKDQRSVPILEGWARRGFVAMSIDYRLRPNGTPGAKSDYQTAAEALAGDSDVIADAQHDMQAAVRWARAHATELGIDPDAIVAAGESAGAIAAWETANNPEDPGTSGTPGVSSEVAAAVSLWGAADPDHVEAGDPPVIEFHGLVDSTVPIPLGAQACALVIGHGGVCEMVVWPNERHAAFGRAAEIVATSSAFLCRRAIPGCTAPEPSTPVTVSP